MHSLWLTQLGKLSVFHVQQQERDDYSVLLRLGVSLAFGKNITWSPCCRRITLFSEHIGDSELGLEEVL